MHAGFGAERTIDVIRLALAGDVDDATPVARHHLVQQGLRDLARAVKVQRHGFLPALFTDMQFGKRARATRVVDQDVDAAQAGHRGIRQGLGRVVRVQVGLNHHRPVPASADNFLGHLVE